MAVWINPNVSVIRRKNKFHIETYGRKVSRAYVRHRAHRHQSDDIALPYPNQKKEINFFLSKRVGSTIQSTPLPTPARPEIPHTTPVLHATALKGVFGSGIPGNGMEWFRSSGRFLCSVSGWNGTHWFHWREYSSNMRNRPVRPIRPDGVELHSNAGRLTLI